MKLPEMKTGLAISALAHAALLVWGLVSFAARPLEAANVDALPVDIISDKQFSELTKGVKTAKEPEPKPLIEKVSDTAKLVDDPTPKPNDKPEIKAAAAEPPPPPLPEPKPPAAKPEKQPPKPDPIAEALKKEEAKKKAEQRAKAKAAKRKPEPKFDPDKIAALLDKREPQRQHSIGDTLVPIPGRGTRTGDAIRLSQSEIDALRARLMRLWNVPAGVRNPEELKVTIVIRIGRDQKLAAPPRVVTSGNSTLFMAARDSAVRAVFQSQPFDMLRPENYELWKEIEITFDPRYMFSG